MMQVRYEIGDESVRFVNFLYLKSSLQEFYPNIYFFMIKDRLIKGHSYDAFGYSDEKTLQ